MRHKLGLFTERAEDAALGRDLLETMAANRADFTLTFRRLSDAAAGSQDDASLRSLFADPLACDRWIARWRERLACEDMEPEARRTAMKAVNPAYIPRNHHVEVIIRAAVDRDDFGPLEELLTVLATPFADQPNFVRYAQPAQHHERVYQTFCGT